MRIMRSSTTSLRFRAAGLLRTQHRSHYSYHGPGRYSDEPALEALWKDRNFHHRGFTVGIGGPVGSGKTALVAQLCRRLDNLAVVTNDIFTQEDAQYLVRTGALPADRVKAVETGGCPHAAIREDVSANLSALEDFAGTATLLLCESGGDNLAANFSRELADLTLYVIDVAGGDKVPRKGGPGITQSDMLIINKVDLAEAVGADLQVMADDARKMRGEAPTVFASVKHGEGMDGIVEFIQTNYEKAMNLGK